MTGDNFCEKIFSLWKMLDKYYFISYSVTFHSDPILEDTLRWRVLPVSLEYRCLLTQSPFEGYGTLSFTFSALQK